MKKLVYGTAVMMTLGLAFPGPTEAQSPPPVQPGGPPVQTQGPPVQTQGPPSQTRAAPPPSPYVAPPMTTTVRKTVIRKRRVRSRSSSDNIANQLNAQELAGAGRGGAMGPPGRFGAPMRPIPVAGPGFPPPFWYPPRPWGPWWRPWGPWWRPWRPY